MQELPDDKATRDPGLEYLARVDSEPDAELDLDACGAATSWLADPSADDDFDASLFHVSTDETSCMASEESAPQDCGPFEVSDEQDDGEWLHVEDDGFELDVEDEEPMSQAEVDAMAAACFAWSPEDDDEPPAEEVSLTASGRVQIADSGVAVEKLSLADDHPPPETVLDDELLAMVGDTLSPEELEGMAALSLDPTDVEKLLAASERIKPAPPTPPAPPAPPTATLDLEPIVDGVREPVIEAIRDLRDSLASYQGIEHLLLELSQGSERSSSRTGESIEEMREELAYLRQEIELTRNATLVFTNTVRELVTSMQATGFSVKTNKRFVFPVTMLALLLCLGTIGWAVNGYRATSELSYAVIGLLAVNLIAGGAMLFCRRSS